ncbi:hypothetical protein [Streptomyces sp. DvalAA-83]|uniref:hypothetical protein n=1 Tax=Streptomyces sp. DvalAA-83 TaxID=1155717 RepID=UPI003FA740BD
MTSTLVPSSTASTTPAAGLTRSSTAAAGACTVTRARWRQAAAETFSATYAAASPSGSSRGGKRGPEGVRGVTRSTRKVRQASRSPPSLEKPEPLVEDVRAFFADLG